MTIPPLVRVALWMAGALVSFSTMAVSIRGLSAHHLSVFEILSIRSGFGSLVLCLLALSSPALRAAVKPHQLRRHLIRNGTHFGGQYLWAYAVTVLPLATVFSLEFTMPAWTIVLAVFTLGERLTPSRIGVVVLGLIGVMVILRPGIGNFRPESMLVLAAAFLYAISMIATKQLTATQTPFAIVFWMNLMQFPMGLAGASLDFAARLTTADILPMLGAGIAGLTSHYCLSNAFRSGAATVVVPLDFMRIPLIALVGWWLYDETLDAFVFAGAAVIITGVVWNLRAETRRQALARAAQPAE